ncbi:MAG TPA: arginase family protein [Thermoleophilaceae bacterium]|nr:arginase family protein [Thermoleophilaceae bacterium]
MPSLAVLDVPLDCSGACRGEERGPAALRAAGLLGRIGARDAGGVDARIRDSSRDPGTGVIGAADVRRASSEVAARVGDILAAGQRPLLLGGDCTLLLGVFSALEDGVGLWFVDGHADFFDGATSPTGEAADMELAILTGHGPSGLVPDSEPLVEPADVVLLGHRSSDLHPDAALENGRIDGRIHSLTAPEVAGDGPGKVGRQAAARLAGRAAWLHLDLDVLDAEALPAVTYPQAGGLGWDELAALARPLVDAPGLVGISVADFNPDRDPHGTQAGQVVELLDRLLGAGPRG